jgi:hypothetical protein
MRTQDCGDLNAVILEIEITLDTSMPNKPGEF